MMMMSCIDQVLLSRVSFFGSEKIGGEESIALQLYRKTAEAVICGLLPNTSSASQRTQGSLSYSLKEDRR
ncbi:hypothetical protein, partial [Corallococcus caeni]|uniref:hypothetical protein n=1 Tax=Corallococcus caeni TaxID=3082388 RepID=UPI0030C705A5